MNSDQQHFEAFERTSFKIVQFLNELERAASWRVVTFGMMDLVGQDELERLVKLIFEMEIQADENAGIISEWENQIIASDPTGCSAICEFGDHTTATAHYCAVLILGSIH